MAKKYIRRDFVIRDLAVTIGGSGGGGTWMPGPDDETPPTPISPIASVIANLGILEAVRATMKDAVKMKEFDHVGRAFLAGDTGGSAAIRAAIQEVGTAVVGSVAYAAIGGGSAGMPNPDCGGNSMETIPTPLTPVVHLGRQVHRVTDLPRLRAQLQETISYVDKATQAQAPRGAEVGAVRAELQAALKNLPAG